VTVDQDTIFLERRISGGRYSHRFEDGSEAELIYFEKPEGIVTITHTETPPRHQGQGVAAALVGRAVADFREAGKSVVPQCAFAAAQFREHPEWADLLARK